MTPDEFAQTYDRLKQEMARVVVGQDELVDGVLVALIAGGHVLIEGAPGLGKTLVARALAVAAGSKFKRVQFTPDLMPSDVTGSSVFDRQSSAFTFIAGPVFAQILLADEINRAPAKTQSSLLALPKPFTVLATQNPVESQGTYPLPEAQLDRFLMKLLVRHPSRDEELTIVRGHANGFDPAVLAQLSPVVTPATILEMQAHAQAIRVDDAVIAYIVDLVRQTRDDRAIELGASPRASISLMKTAQVVAASQGRAFVTPDDVKPMAAPVLRHRLMLHPDAQLQGISPDDRIAEIVARVAVPRLAQ